MLFKLSTVQHYTKMANGFALKIKNAKQPFLLKKNEYYEELASIVEILKVEGWWNPRGVISITSKSPELLTLFDSLLKFHEIHTRWGAIIKFKLPSKLNEEDKKKIKILKNEKELKFRFGRNGFTGELDHVVFHSPLEESNYLVKCGEQQFLFETKVSNEELSTNMREAKIYGVIRASNKTFVWFATKILNEKEKSSEIRLNNFLKEAQPEIIAKVFARVVDCEGSIQFYGHKRAICVRMKNKQYLEDWRELLNKIGIPSRLDKQPKGLTALVITNNQHFEMLSGFGFSLCHKEKKARFEKILKSYQKHQVRRNSALSYYLLAVKENPHRGAFELAKITNKSKRVVSHYLKKLVGIGQIKFKAEGQKHFYYPTIDNNKESH